MKVQNYVIVPDLQIPLHDKRFISNLTNYIADVQPYGVVFIGDNVDCTAPATWSRSTQAEFAGTLQGEFDEWFSIASKIRDTFAGWVGVHYGNHEKRITSYLKHKAAAFSSLSSLRLSSLLRLEELGFEELGDHYSIAPGWVTHHGDYASVSDIAGRTASNYANRIGRSVIMGHTHRAAIVPESYGYDGRLATRYGMEVGHGMLESKADYTNGVMNWQKAFGELEVVEGGKYINPSLTYARRDGSFYARGKLYAG